MWWGRFGITQVNNSSYFEKLKLLHSHADFVTANDKGHLAAPGVDEARPAGVQGDVLPVAGADADGGVVEGLTCMLQD